LRGEKRILSEKNKKGEPERITVIERGVPAGSDVPSRRKLLAGREKGEVRGPPKPPATFEAGREIQKATK